MAQVTSAIRAFFCLFYNSLRWPVVTTAVAVVPALAVYYALGGPDTPLAKVSVLAAGLLGLGIAVWANRTSLPLLYSGLRWPVVATVVAVVPALAIYYTLGSADAPTEKAFILAAASIGLGLAVWANTTTISATAGLVWVAIAVLLIAAPGWAAYYYVGGIDTAAHKAFILAAVFITLWLVVCARSLVGIVLLSAAIVALFRLVDHLVNT